MWERLEREAQAQAQAVLALRADPEWSAQVRATWETDLESAAAMLDVRPHLLRRILADLGLNDPRPDEADLRKD